jgi:catechol 2,3-dioxygenase-like lactoylglutathione lyase family enzyme
MKPQPMITVADVPASSRWYQAVLGSASGHGGAEYEQIVCDGQLILQLHAWDAHEHPHLGNPQIRPYGNGSVLWFQTERFDAALERIGASGAVVLEGPAINPFADHREIWLRDPDGYVVVIAGLPGDLGTASADGI